MKCKACGKPCRKGTVSTAYVFVGHVLERARLCARCAASAVLILPRQAAGACACGKSATTCGACCDGAVDKAKRETVGVKTIAKTLRQRARAYEAQAQVIRSETEQVRLEGLTQGLEQAADFLEKGTLS